MEHLHFIGEITCKHNYDPQYKGIAILPTQETQSFCQREGVWLYQTDGKVAIYADHTYTGVAQTKAFMFWVKVTDIQFYNYIQLDNKLQGQGYLLSFSNTKKNETLTLADAKMRNIQRKTQIVVFDEVVSEEEEEIKVYNTSGVLVHKTFVTKGSKSTLLDLTYEEDGLYTWTFSGHSGSFFLTNENLKYTIGVCLFQVKSEGKHQIDIQFQTKKTYWEYLIISKEELSENAYTIVDSNNTYTFTCLGKKDIVDKEVLCYLSDQEIPYKKHPKTFFKLVPNSENTNPYLALEDRILPNASPENIRIHHTAERTAFKTQTILYI